MSRYLEMCSFPQAPREAILTYETESKSIGKTKKLNANNQNSPAVRQRQLSSQILLTYACGVQMRIHLVKKDC